jgi:hypothetical protein
MLKVHFTAGTRAGRVVWLLEELGLDYEGKYNAIY